MTDHHFLILEVVRKNCPFRKLATHTADAAKEASSFFMLASPPPEKSVAHPVSTDLLTEIWNNAKIHLIFGCQVPHGSGMIAVNTRD